MILLPKYNNAVAHDTNRLSPLAHRPKGSPFSKLGLAGLS